ncbi:MAG: hypothetical protein SH818_19080 [Saprospiraceae bacterium]|nr:hypothetical protein [Saprospiraceae bacterium]
MKKYSLSPFLLILLFICLFIQVKGQILDSENKISLILKDGTNVTLFGQASSLSDDKTNTYYYLPCNLRLSKKADGTPEFLFLKYTSDEKGATGNTQGGLLHLLMIHGLTKAQETEVNNLLKSKYNGATLKGAADVEAQAENSVKIISGILSSKEMTRSLVFSGKASTLPGGKIALAALLDKQGAQLFSATLEKIRSITDLSVNLSFNYTVRVPAAKGYVKEDWSKLDSMMQKDSANFSKSEEKDYGEKVGNTAVGYLFGGPIGGLLGWFGSSPEEHYSYDEMRDFYRKLEEQKVVTLRFEENVADERVTKIREAFFQHFLNAYTEKDAANPRDPGPKEKEAMPDIKTGDSYKYKREIREVIKQHKVQIFDLSYALAVKRDHQLTENLAAWYDHAKDNPKCIGLVNLNDPFFQYRDINVILDLEAEEMMNKEVNFVTVNLRKKRSGEGANDFNADVTFDRKFLELNGNRTIVTYSKAQDEGPDTYEYKTQWSLKGGESFPANDSLWIKGSWQGINLAPPVKPRTVRFETDMADMKEAGIKNVTLQLRYLKFKNEVETNVNINVSGTEPFAEKMIFVDRNSQGYAYRLVFHDKDLGPLATPWEAKINTDYIYATLPKELREKKQDWIKTALNAASAMVGTGENGKISKEQQILNKFKQVLEISGATKN